MKRLLCLLLLVLALPVLAPHAHAELRIEINRGTVEAVPVAVPFFHAESSTENTFSRDIATVVQENLESTGLFEVIDRAAYLQPGEQLAEGVPHFPDWRVIKAQALVSGSVTRSPDGRLRVAFRLWDVFAENQMTGVAYTTVPENWRRIAHIISDEIYKRLTGEEGYFDTRVVYISETGRPDQRIKRLAIMDQDGHNHRFLTSGDYLVLTPRFSPTSQEITYLAYVNNRPRVYLYNIDTGRQEVLGDFPGMTFSPRFSPDGNSVIMSMSLNGNSDIYVMDLRTRRVTQLTSNLAIETAPSFAPDAQQIVFESDRGGSQQLYVMNADGTGVKRISYGDGRYGNPVWSPRGDLIAFTKIHKGQFYVGVMHPDGSGERTITRDFHVEGPTWAPNGRVLMFFKERAAGPDGLDKETALYSIDITGFNERRVKTPLYGSDPAWSPLIP